jgi:transposase
MNTKEMKRMEVMQKLAERRMMQKKAAEELGISVRQVKRLWKAYCKKGAAGLVSQQRGKTSHNHLSEQTEQAVVDLLHSRYADFGPTLAQEKLVEKDGIQISVSSVRKIMIGEELWKAKKARKVAAYQMRERRSCFGELLQIDGSPYDWFEGRAPKCSLLVFIDDATGRLVQLLFVESERFFSYCRAAEGYFTRCGKPSAFYSDLPGQSTQQRLHRRLDPVWTGYAGTPGPDHLRQHASGKRSGRAGQPDPPA